MSITKHGSIYFNDEYTTKWQLYLSWFYLNQLLNIISFPLNTTMIFRKRLAMQLFLINQYDQCYDTCLLKRPKSLYCSVDECVFEYPISISLTERPYIPQNNSHIANGLWRVSGLGHFQHISVRCCSGSQGSMSWDIMYRYLLYLVPNYTARFNRGHIGKMVAAVKLFCVPLSM